MEPEAVRVVASIYDPPMSTRTGVLGMAALLSLAALLLVVGAGERAGTSRADGSAPGRSGRAARVLIGRLRQNRMR